MNTEINPYLDPNISAQDALFILQISYPTLLKFRREGKITYTKNPNTGRVKYDYASVMELKKAREL